MFGLSSGWAVCTPRGIGSLRGHGPGWWLSQTVILFVGHRNRFVREMVMIPGGGEIFLGSME